MSFAASLNRDSEAPAHGAVAEPGRLARHAWSIYLATIALLVTGYGLAHISGPDWLKGGLVFNLIGGSTVAALIIGARRNSATRRLPWYLLAVGQGLFVTSDVLTSNYERLFGTALPFPSVADVFHIAFYPFLVAGMLLLIRERDETRDRAGMIDALMVTVALSTLLWVYLIAPYADNHTLSLLRRLTSVAYPAMDILVLGVVARIAAGSHRRQPAFGFLLAGATVLLLSDVFYGWKLLEGGYETSGVLDTGWALYYTLLGTAALHPSMRRLAAPGPEPESRLTGVRLALLTCASLTAPLLIVVRDALHETVDPYVLVGASALMFALVLTRMAGIVHRNEEATRREAALRSAGEALVTAATREEIYAAALGAAQSVVEQDVTACLYLADSGGDALTAVGSSQGDLGSLPALCREDLPERVRTGLSGNSVHTLDRSGRLICLSPLIVRERLTGVLAVLASVPLTRAAEESLATLASEVALALQSVALTEESAHQRSEARLSSLIKNASDVICIVGEDGLVNYMSPSVQRTFGYDPEAVTNRPLTDIVHPDEAQRVFSLFASIATQTPGRVMSAEFRVRHSSEDAWRDVEALGTNLLGDEAIDGIVLNIRDISERKAFEAELEHQAFHDTLTGLPNRALFRNRVEHALAGKRREHHPVAVLFLDIDDFKNLNDSLGHAAGDELIRELAHRLEECMRPVDTAARLGGDEFAILIHEAKSELQAIEIAHRIMDAMHATIRLKRRDVNIATSIGIAFSDEGMVSGQHAEELLRNADAAMYMAKENGKGHYQVFQPEMHAKALARLELKTDLQRALDAGEFTLRYQPIMDLGRGDIAGMEALVRWEHPDRGTVQPLEFISLLEDTGLIVPVGRQILWEACTWAAHMQTECPRDPPLSMAVNVSACQLQRPEFIEEVRGVLRATGIVPSSLTLELTESVMMQDMELSLLRLNALRALGVKLAIDDFGTGYSSLNYIRQLPVDILKIDRSFLADPNPEVAEMTAAIVGLARIFNLKAVAEGIENPGQLARLQGINCDFGQGFHFAKPLLGAEILAMASSQPAMRAVHITSARAARALA
ncbi:MAG: EAL domain-containing protein [Solirubrobacteraceae bacterium]|jgi:diguanylate cyclase (GGDEF)-like protein/PAS domain S-box-containing protein